VGGGEMTTFIEEVDDILNNHAQEFKAGHMDTVRDSLLDLVSERIIGENEQSDVFSSDGDKSIKPMFRNKLRNDQRTTLYEGTKEETTDEA
jgi:hypothetical protein